MTEPQSVALIREALPEMPEPVTFGVSRVGTIFSGYTEANMRAYAKAAIAEVLQHVAALTDLCDRLKQEAQIHAQEARTANSTIAEIYQCVTGSTGEPGNWNGANPVREKIAALSAQVLELEADARRYRWLRDQGATFYTDDGARHHVCEWAMNAAIDAALSAAARGEPT